MKLETKRLVLRPVSGQDKSALFAYRSDKATNRYQGWIPENEEEAAAFIAKVAKEMNVPGSWFQFVIEEKGQQHIIGDLGIRFPEDDIYQAEVGCTLSKDYHHCGYAFEALSRVIDFVFEELQKHRIFTSIDPANTGAIRLVERLGFRKEAHFRKSLLLNGVWVDDVVYALLEEEWEVTAK